jgi:hypothetical protein
MANLKRRCAMAGDDACLGSYQMTSAFRTCLNAAADHLHTVTSLVVEHRQLNLAATGSLARGAIENGATAFWLLHPKSRDERIMHTLHANLVGRDAKVVREASPGISQMQFTNTMERALCITAGGLWVITAALRVHQDRTVAASRR